MAVMLRWVVALVAVVSAGAFAGCGDDEKQPPATLVAILTGSGDATSPRTLRVFDAVTGETKLETDPGSWFAPAFSPDGKRLVALLLPDRSTGGNGDDATLHFFDVDTGKDDTIAVPIMGLDGMVWAPDSSRFAYSAKSELVVTDRRGQRVGEAVTGIVKPDSWRTGGTAWSPDSKLVAASIEGEILFATREGKPAGKLRAEDMPGAQAGDVIQLWEWQADGRLAVTRASQARGLPPDFFAVALADGKVNMTAYAAGAEPTLEAESQTFQADVAETERLVPGGRYRHGGRTADGAGRVVEVDPTTGSPAGFRSTLVVFTAAGSLVVDSGLPVPSRLQRNYSVVITK